MTDLTLSSARGDRDALANRTDVLDKVGVLRTLPDDMHVAPQQVADFYGVTLETLRQLVVRNRGELDSDGYVVVKRSEVGDKLSLTPEQLGMPSTAPTTSLFPRRAVLRVGMLLRDSDVAKQVRTMLLDVEQADAEITFLIPKTLPEALRLAADQYERAELEAARADAAETANRVLTARIEKDAPLIAKAEAHSRSDSMIHRQAFAREVQQWGVKQGIKVNHEHVYELLRRKGMLIAGDRSDRNHATSQAVRAGWAWTKKDVVNEHATAVTYLYPKGQDLAWKWISDHVKQFGDLRPQAGVA